jgi:hypothetical protein
VLRDLHRAGRLQHRCRNIARFQKQWRGTISNKQAGLRAHWLSRKDRSDDVTAANPGAVIAFRRSSIVQQGSA